MTRPWYSHPSAYIDDGDPSIGEGTRIWHHTHVMAGARIGRSCNIGQNCYIDAGVVIGDGCKLQNNVNVYRGVTLKDHVFCGPSMTFTNLSKPLPRAHISRHQLLQQTLVEEGASFGAQSVVVCGITVGRYAFVAAGAVVIRPVRAFELVAGNPARHLGWVCKCGERLVIEGDLARCDAAYESDEGEVRCGERYEVRGGDLHVAS